MLTRTKRSFYVLTFCMTQIVLFGLNEPQTCEKYRVGKFYIYNKSNRQRINIERKDSLQIETNERTGNITILKLNWLSSCEYELYFNYATPKEVAKEEIKPKIVESLGVTPLTIKILSGTDDYYVFEARKEGFMNLRDTVWLVK